MGVIPLELGVELQAPLPPSKSGISPSLHTSPMECTGQGMLGATTCISETLSLAIGCAPLLLWLQCQSGNCDQTTVGTILICMCPPPYDTRLNSGHKVCFKQESPPDTENWARSLTTNHTYHTAPAVKPPFLRPTYFQKKRGRGGHNSE